MNKNNHFRKYWVIFSLIFVFCFANLTSVKAQKIPPVLEKQDSEITAFSLARLKSLTSSYNTKSESQSENELEQARLIRNKLIAMGVEQIDANFNSYQKKNRKRNELLQFFLDFVEIGAATAISITNGERAKSIIAEGLGALQASRTSLNKNFKLLERQIIVNQMVTDRATVLKIILDKLNQDVAQYSWEAARSDLRNYYNAGTFDSAVSSLSINTGKQADEAEEEIRQLKGNPLTKSATLYDLDLSKQARPILDKLKKDLADTNSVTSGKTLGKLQTIVSKLEENSEIKTLLKNAEVSKETADGAKILKALNDIISNSSRSIAAKVKEVVIAEGNN